MSTKLASSEVLPSFIVIGAQKAGTTALYHYLRQHPDVFMSPVKEPNFFAFEGAPPAFRDADGRPSPINATSVTDWDAYQGLFAGRTHEAAVGEASPHYLYVPEAAAHLRRRLPNAKLIAFLRNPVDRAFSAYMHALRSGRESARDFAHALDLEDARIHDGYGFLYHYTRIGRYAEQLDRFDRLFDPSQLRVYLYDDLVARGTALIQDVYAFVGVDDAFVPDTQVRYNPSGIPKNRALHGITRAVTAPHGFVRNAFVTLCPPALRARMPTRAVAGAMKRLQHGNLHKPQLTPALRARLTELFREDILRLQDRLGRDLTHWISPTRPSSAAAFPSLSNPR